MLIFNCIKNSHQVLEYADDYRVKAHTVDVITKRTLVFEANYTANIVSLFFLLVFNSMNADKVYCFVGIRACSFISSLF